MGVETRSSFIKETLVQGRRSLWEPTELKLLLMSLAGGYGLGKGLDTIGVDLNTVTPNAIPSAVLLTSGAALATSLYKFTVGKDKNAFSRVTADEIMQRLWAEADTLKGMCDQLHADYLLRKTPMPDSREYEGREARIDEARRQLRYVSVAMQSLAASIVRNESNFAFRSLAEVCKSYKPIAEEDKPNAEIPAQYDLNKRVDEAQSYENFFKAAVTSIDKSPDFAEPLKASNINLLVEVLNQLEDYYNQLFVEYRYWLGLPPMPEDVSMMVTQKVNHAESEVLDFVRSRDVQRRDVLFICLLFSGLSTLDSTTLNTFQTAMTAYLQEVIDFLANHANMIVGTTASYMGLKVLSTLNSRLIPDHFLARRIAPTSHQVKK